MKVTWRLFSLAFTSAGTFACVFLIPTNPALPEWHWIAVALCTYALAVDLLGLRRVCAEADAEGNQ